MSGVLFEHTFFIGIGLSRMDKSLTLNLVILALFRQAVV